MDIDDQLEMLQRQLMAVQEEKTNPLSERTVAEIMVKLYHEGFAFYPTTDGNQYVTPEQLDREITALVMERGRINLAILPQILNLGIDTVESRVNSVMQRSSISRHANSLISQRYFQNLIAGLRQILVLQGRVELQQVAIQHQLNMQFLQKLVSQRMVELQAQLIGHQLITREYTLLKKMKLLGFLSALNNPISLDVLLKTTGIEPRNVQDLIVQLIDQNKLKGKFQNYYYVPHRFTLNQHRLITQFFKNNGFISSEMLQRKFLVSKPEEWIQKNLKDYQKIQKVYFSKQKIQSCATQANSMLKSEGFVELSHVLPVELQQKYLNYFLQEHCQLKEYFICDGFVYSNEWLQRLAAEFKEKILYSIFFKKDVKGKDAKKKGKKEKTELLTEQQLQQTMFNCGFADYSVSQNLAPELLPLMLQRLQEMRKRVDKELSQNKGFINSTFLKYRNCKSILRTQESLTRMLNVIQKQQKKGEKWMDGEFGPNQNDKTGQYSLIYYDNALPKGWPSLQSLRWKQISTKDLLNAQLQPNTMKRCQLIYLLQLIDKHNAHSTWKLHHPQITTLSQRTINIITESDSPFVFQFFISQKQKRLVIVDQRLPYIQDKSIFVLSRYSLAEKAYAKLRYCYKGIMSVGIQQLLLELTGRAAVRYTIEGGQKDRELLGHTLMEHVRNNDWVMVMGEGEGDKQLIYQDRQTGYFNLKPYSLSLINNRLQIFPRVGDQQIRLEMVLQMFRNVVVIAAMK